MNINNAAVRTIDIITFLAKTKKSATLTEIAQGCNIPKSSALDIVYTLIEKGIVQIDNEQFKTYKLTVRLFELGTAVVNGNNLQSASHRVLKSLCEKTNTTVFLAVPQKDLVVYISKYEGMANVQSACSVGDTNPMTLTGIGKAMLAAYSNEKIHDLLGDGPYTKRTSRSISNYEDLIREMEQTRRRGYAIDDREGVDILYCYAAPVYDYTNRMIAAISVVCLYHDMDETMRSTYPQLVTDAAMEISRQMGFQGSCFYR